MIVFVGRIRRGLGSGGVIRVGVGIRSRIGSVTVNSGRIRIGTGSMIVP